MARPGVADRFKQQRAAAVHTTGSTRASLSSPFAPGGAFTPGGGIFAPRGPTFGNPFAPTGGGGSPIPSGGGGGPLGGLCDLLPAGFARDACKVGSGFLPGSGGSGGGTNGSGPCPDGSFKVGNRCVAPGDMFPGGDPGMFPAGGEATQGAFGMPALTPAQEQRTVLKCPSGMVLGKDDLCYPKAILSRRSKYRKWKGDPRPPVTAADAKAVRRAERVRNRVKDLGKDVGLKVTNR